MALAALVALCGLLTGCTNSLPQADGFEQVASRQTSLPAGNSLVRVAAASDLRFALAELIAEFKKTDPGVTVEATYGSSGNLSTQIVSGAPFDVFLSADRSYAHRLVEQELADAESEFVYAQGELVLWVRSDSPLNLNAAGVRALAAANIRRIAIANPEHAPYGRAAVAALRHLELYDQVSNRLVLGENVAQAAQFVETGAADAGLIALSLAVAPTMKDKGRYLPLPADSYPELEQTGVVLRAAGDPAAARRFCAFVAADAGQQVLDKFGFQSTNSK
ncbi:MAG: molybdate ABC transporter substrate-binding protein [Pirellulales bacterium]